MTAKHLSKALQHFRRVLRPPGNNDLTDGQLLARFVSSRDEAAFNELVRRHGPMVLGVCRRILRHTQDAEDAFQAAFLVLSRKAASVVNRHAVGSWLYRVSYRIALEAKTINDKRRRREKQVEEMPHPEVAAIEPRDERRRLPSVGPIRAGGVPENKLDRKPRTELEALRRENELLKLNLEVVLEKVRSQETELRTLRGQVNA